LDTLTVRVGDEVRVTPKVVVERPCDADAATVADGTVAVEELDVFVFSVPFATFAVRDGGFARDTPTPVVDRD
jgi:hypothetical protein